MCANTAGGVGNFLTMITSKLIHDQNDTKITKIGLRLAGVTVNYRGLCSVSGENSREGEGNQGAGDNDSVEYVPQVTTVRAWMKYHTQVNHLHAIAARHRYDFVQKTT